MDVATYVLFSVGCHIQGQIEGTARRKECEGALPGASRPEPAFAWMIRRAPQVKRVAVHAGWAGLGAVRSSAWRMLLVGCPPGLKAWCRRARDAGVLHGE